MNENGTPAAEPEDEVKRVRQGAAVAFHEYRKALMPLAGASEYCATKCARLFQDLEQLAQDLPEEHRARLLELIAGPREALGKMLEHSAKQHRFLIATLEQLVLAAQPDTEAEGAESPSPNAQRPTPNAD